MKTMAELFNSCRIIAATHSDEEFLRALKSEPKIIFDLDTDLMNISAKVKKAHEADKLLFVHIDFVKGLGKDESGIRFLKRVGADGVVSTKAGMIKLAREQGLHTVQRFFIVDTHSVSSAIETVKSSKAEMVELMPGILGKVIDRVSKSVDVPIIVGGLIEFDHEIEDAFKNGAAAISTGRHELWSVK